jgi:N-alpha-acetyltransferase 15/16, NatA auxiliary subunit
MKGLVLTHMGRREEGLELVKTGMRLDLTSHITWHVFGLIQKGEKKYEEALKSYTQALKFDKVSIDTKRLLAGESDAVSERLGQPEPA